MIVDDAYQALFLHPQYWYLGHFAKFVPPGSKRVGIQASSAAGATLPPQSEPSGSIYNFTEGASVAYGACPAGPPRVRSLCTRTRPPRTLCTHHRA
jgi:hypothetical protein